MARHIPLLAAVAGLSLASAVALPAAADAAPRASTSAGLERSLQAAPETLRTPFEKSNGATWTTFDQWLDFWSHLDDASDRVDVDRIATSSQGRPIHAITVGHPAPTSARTQARGSVLMLNCSIHGDEPSGREACMIVARDLASSKDPRVVRFLSRTTVVMTDINPDGWVADTRTNADDIDLNRDFLTLQADETRALVKLIGERKPDVLNDLHEYGPRKDYDTDSLTLWPRNRNVDRGVHKLAKSMVEDYTRPRIESHGLTDGVYGQLVRDGEPYRQIAGDGQARILRNYSGLRHIVGQLTEARNEPIDDAEKKDPAGFNRQRVTVQYASVVGSMELLESSRAKIAKATVVAERRSTTMGAQQKGIVYFGGQDDMLPTEPEEVESSPMCGYRLTPAQLRAHGEVLALHGIRVKPTVDGAWVPMGQPGRGLIPLLLDARSEFGVAQATPMKECPAS